MPRFLHTQKSAELLSSIPFFGEKSKVLRSSSVRLANKRNKASTKHRHEVHNEDQPTVGSKSSTWNRWVTTPKRRMSARKGRKPSKSKSDTLSPQFQSTSQPFEGTEIKEDQAEDQTIVHPSIEDNERELSGSPISPPLGAVGYNPRDSTTSFSTANEVYQTTLQSDSNVSLARPFVSTPIRRGSLHKTRMDPKSRYRPHSRAPVEGLFNGSPPEDIEEWTGLKSQLSTQMEPEFSSPPSFLKPSDSFTESIRQSSPHLMRRRDSQTSVASALFRDRALVGSPPLLRPERSRRNSRIQILTSPTRTSLTPNPNSLRASPSRLSTSAAKSASPIRPPRPLTKDEHIKREWNKIRAYLNVVDDSDEEDWPPPCRIESVAAMPVDLYRPAKNYYIPKKRCEGFDRDAVVDEISKHFEQMVDMDKSGTELKGRKKC